ncbi:MAG TPA: protein translocase subunit SecD [Dermatophilaceae bacterium]|jgi:preprotein translocase subunit SecD|nr:protein translocase subunit SecD [Dermatophilaceae bacterium]
MANPRTRGPRRVLWTLLLLTVMLFGGIGAAHKWGTASLSPKLGLDLEGGTQMVLEPVLADKNAAVSAGQLEKARDIIAQRVDSNGVAEAEITTQSGRNIVISIPGQPDTATLDQIRKPSQLRFRAVLATAAGNAQANSTSSPTGTTAVPTTAGPVFTMDPAPSAPAPSVPVSAPATSANAPIPPALAAADPTPPVSTPATSSSPAATATSTATAAPKNASDLSWITPEIEKEFIGLDCTKAGAINDFVDDPAKPLVTCSTQRDAKYILGPVELDGTDIADAASGYQPGPNGQPTSIVEVTLKFTGDGAKKFADVTTRLFGLKTTDETRNRFAVVLDKQVITAPSTNAVIANGQASITGNFTIDSARALAQQLKFGALPMSFALQTQEDISPTLGSEQLALGLLAGLIGLLLVVIYSLFQYRLLGLVTVASLIVAAVLTYGVLTLLGWTHNVRLTMAGVTGVIVAIGVTADSFIVYFERIRDEVREGRPLVTAVDAGWARAKRTILAADAVNLLAAIVLYVLAASNVRGFAFTLGVTTLIDLAVVFLFTHPLVAILAHTKFFGGGHRWSGLDPERLGATTRYVGRGRFAAPTLSSEGKA